MGDIFVLSVTVVMCLLPVCLSLPSVRRLLWLYVITAAKMCLPLSFVFFYEQDESESSEHILLHFIIYLLCDINGYGI